jgi:hypothetical protein
MKGKMWLAVVSGFLLVGTAFGAEWWEKKHFLEWSAKEARRMLDDSPWGKIHRVTIMNPSHFGERNFESIGGGDLEREKHILFHIRFLTAKPIRMAISRQMMLEQKDEVDTSVISHFVEQGDPKYLVIAVALSAKPKGTRAVSNFWTALMNLKTSDLTSNTFLSAKSGKRVYLSSYLAPQGNGLGARFLFSRTLSDGKPLVTADEKEIRFETVIPSRKLSLERGTGQTLPKEVMRTDKVWGVFKLKKMRFQGKLET